MKGTLHKTEQGWVVRFLQNEPKYIGEKQSLQEIPIYPDYVALCSYSFYEGKEVEFEILQGADVLYAHLFKSNPKEQQKQLITEIMELDAKDGLYDTVNKMAEEMYGKGKVPDYEEGFIDGYNKAKEIEKKQSQPEISDDEIEIAAANLANPNADKTDNWIEGCKWYREQLKNKKTKKD